MNIEEQVFSIFSSFIRDLSTTFPEIEGCLNRNYEKEITGKDLKLEDCPKIKVFLDKVHEHKSLIENKDESFFNNDIELLEEISFQRLWEKNLSQKNRETLWKYFKTFTIITINLNSNQQLQEALETIGNQKSLDKEDIKDKKTAKDLKDLKKLTEDVQQGENVSEGESELENMLGGLIDSDIGKIAKEVSETMNIEKMFGDINEETNPMDIMGQIMNPEKMGSIFKNIQEVMDRKMKSGDINKEGIQEEAKNIYGKMSDNPMFSNLANQMGNMNQVGPRNPMDPMNMMNMMNMMNPMNSMNSMNSMNESTTNSNEQVTKEVTKEVTEEDKERIKQKKIQQIKQRELSKEEKKEKLRKKIREKEKQRRK